MSILQNIRRNCVCIFGLFLIIVILLQKQVSKEIFTIRKYGLDFELNYKVVKSYRKRSLLKASQNDVGSDCNTSITLENVGNISSLDYGIFMMETSGNRDLCEEKR